MNKSKELSNTQKPANCGYTVLPAVFCKQEEELIANYMGEKAISIDFYHNRHQPIPTLMIATNSTFAHIISNQFFFLLTKNGR